MTTDNGERLAAILPTGISRVLAENALSVNDPRLLTRDRLVTGAGELPPIRSFVLVVVDGLGWHNLSTRRGHAPTLARLLAERVSTVTPSTTGAALTTLLTGRLPGSHGLVGYRIRHPRLGLRSTLKEWQGIVPDDRWQRATPLLRIARDLGLQSFAMGRPAHHAGGLTEAVLDGAEYVGGQRMEDRFTAALSRVRQAAPSVSYVYIDELDRAGHAQGWESSAWSMWLERLDAELRGFLAALPEDVGVVITADHGMVDIPESAHIELDAIPVVTRTAVEIGGEPRFRTLYLRAGEDPMSVAAEVQGVLGESAWVAPRDAAVQAGLFGPMDAEVQGRLGEVIIAAREEVAFVLRSDPASSRAMIGQHGSLTDEEREVPVIPAGAWLGCRLEGLVGPEAGN